MGTWRSEEMGFRENWKSTYVEAGGGHVLIYLFNGTRSCTYTMEVVICTHAFASSKIISMKKDGSGAFGKRLLDGLEEARFSCTGSSLPDQPQPKWKLIG